MLQHQQRAAIMQQLQIDSKPMTAAHSSSHFVSTNKCRGGVAGCAVGMIVCSILLSYATFATIATHFAALHYATIRVRLLSAATRHTVSSIVVVVFIYIVYHISILKLH